MASAHAGSIVPRVNATVRALRADAPTLATHLRRRERVTDEAFDVLLSEAARLRSRSFWSSIRACQQAADFFREAGATRVLVASMAPLARDFTYDSSRDEVVFARAVSPRLDPALIWVLALGVHVGKLEAINNPRTGEPESWRLVASETADEDDGGDLL